MTVVSITHDAFLNLLHETKVPCLVTANDATNGLELTAIHYMNEANGAAILIPLAHSDAPTLTVGACVLVHIDEHKKMYGTPTEPVNLIAAADLREAREELLSNMFAN